MFLLFGCLAGVVAFLSFIALLILHIQSEPTTAHIVRYEKIIDKNSGTESYKAVYAYDVADKTFEGRRLENLEKPGVIGSEIAIRYVRNHPNWSSEDSILAIYFLPILTAILGGLMFALHRLLLWLAKKAGSSGTGFQPV